MWLESTKFGDDKDRVIIREDGRGTYLSADLAYHRNKLDRGFDTIINVWGSDHHGYIKRIEATIEAMGYSKKQMQVQLVQFANLFENGSKVKMSTRSGNFYTLSIWSVAGDMVFCTWIKGISISITRHSNALIKLS